MIASSSLVIFWVFLTSSVCNARIDGCLVGA